MGNSDHGTTYMRVGGDDGELRPWHYIYEVGGDDGELRPWHWKGVSLGHVGRN